MGGGGVVEGNLFFNLNRETHDTAALNSWGRRFYIFSDDTNDGANDANASSDPAAHTREDSSAAESKGNSLHANTGKRSAAKARLVPERMNSWRNNLIFPRPLGTLKQDSYRWGPSGMVNLYRLYTGGARAEWLT
jgi:hypothetical protein